MSITFQPHAFARTDRSRLGVWWWTIDRWLLGAAAILMQQGITSPAARPVAGQTAVRT